MKHIIALTKVMTKSSFDDQFNAFKGKKYAGIKSFALFSFMFIYLGGILAAIGDTVLNVLIQINQPTLFIYLIFYIAPIYIVLTTLFSVANVLYYSSDNATFFTYPVKPFEIITAKLVTIFIQSLLYLMVFCIPLFLVYFYRVPSNIFQILFSIIGLLIIPIIPLCIAAIVIVVLFTFTPFFKNKEVFTYASVLIAIAFGLTVSQIGTVLGSSSSIDLIVQSIQSGNNAVYTLIGSVFPTTGWLASFIIENNVIGLLLSLALTVGIYILTIVIVEPLYFRAVLSFTETKKSNKRLSFEQIKSGSGKKSPIKAIMSYDIKNIFRTPVFFTNYFLPVIIVPVAILVPILTNGNINISELIDHTLIYDFLGQFSFIDTVLYVLSVSAILGIFSGNLTSSASTALSRDGLNLSEFLTFPIDMKTVIRAKFNNSFLSSMFIPTFSILALAILLKLPIYIPLFAFIGATSGVIMVTLCGLLLDVSGPRIHWVNEQDAVKGNMRQIIVILPFMIIPFMLIPAVLLTPPLVFCAILYSVIIVSIAVLAKTIDTFSGARLITKLQK